MNWSLMDTWVLLANLVRGEEHVRTVNILKSQGMNHSDRVAKFDITSKGLVIRNIDKS